MQVQRSAFRECLKDDHHHKSSRTRGVARHSWRVVIDPEITPVLPFSSYFVLAVIHQQLEFPVETRSCIDDFISSAPKRAIFLVPPHGVPDRP